MRELVPCSTAHPVTQPPRPPTAVSRDGGSTVRAHETNGTSSADCRQPRVRRRGYRAASAPIYGGARVTVPELLTKSSVKRPLWAGNPTADTFISCRWRQIVHLILGLCSKHPKNTHSCSKPRYLEPRLLMPSASPAKVGGNKTLRSPSTRPRPARAAVRQQTPPSEGGLNPAVAELNNTKPVRRDKPAPRLPGNITGSLQTEDFQN